MPPAARITDNVTHPLPPVLTQGPGSPDVIIGGLPAWRGIPGAAVAGLQAAKQASDVAIQTAEAATLAAAGTPGAPAAKAAEETTKATAAATMGSMISNLGAGTDIHMCSTPLPVPPHGPGVVIDGSPTVLINNMPACRMGDTILEAVGPPNKIVRGEPTVMIGNTGGGSPAAGGGGGGQGPGASGTGQTSSTGPQEGTGAQPVSTETGGVPRFGNALAEAAETGDAFCEICLE
ncbi:MAG TPA: PAAR domain-containing protein [Bryobacteraceae bacterium]|nr:PAAR domain-containing protein [Bryobacteraceae bacterium]